MKSDKSVDYLFVVFIIFLLFWFYHPITFLLAQSPVAFKESLDAKINLAPSGTRFYFDIIESCDEKYLGDTPSHTGRHGGLTMRPRLSLGDSVYRNTEDLTALKIGTITQISWERISGGLSIEFSPEPLLRVCVGEEVWVDINPAQENCEKK